jgi:hypothetical protein
MKSAGYRQEVLLDEIERDINDDTPLERKGGAGDRRLSVVTTYTEPESLYRAPPTLYRFPLK